MGTGQNLGRLVSAKTFSRISRTVQPAASASGQATWRWMFAVKTTLAIGCAPRGGLNPIADNCLRQGFEVRAQARAFPYGIVLRTILVTYVWVKQICVQKLEGPYGVAPFPASNARLANFAKRAALVKIPNSPVRITPIPLPCVKPTRLFP